MKLPGSEHTATAVGIVRVDIPASRREVNADTVKRIAESIEKIGLQYPITVALPGADNRVRLISGRHRLEAFRVLGRSHIPAYLSRLSGTDERLWEISENLHRSELTALERAEQTAEYARLIGESKPAQVGPVSGGRGNTGGDRQAARDLGVKRQEIQRSKAIDSITPEAKAAAVDAGIADNQSALLRVAAKPQAEQAAAVREEASKREVDKQRDAATQAIDSTCIDLDKERAAREAADLIKTALLPRAAADLLDLLSRCDGHALLEALRANLAEAPATT